MLGEKSLDELTCLKRELKAWESMFERRHARKPNKDDVNSAPEEIRETYLKYNQLKRGSKDAKKIVTQQKDKDEIEDEVFGKSLNKSRTPVSAKKSTRIKISPTEYKPIKLCHGQRPKKLLTDKSKTNFIDSKNCENVKQPENESQSSSMVAINDSSISDDLGFSISSGKKDVLNKPGMMLGKSALAKRMKRRSALASDWLEKNQLEPSEGSLNKTDPTLGRSNEVNSFSLDFRGELYDGNNEASEDNELGKSGMLKAEKISTTKLIVPDNTTGFQTEATEDLNSMQNSRLNKSETSGNVSTKQALKQKSNSIITYNTGDNNADLISTSGTRDTIDRERPKKSSASKFWSDERSTSAVAIMRRSAGCENVDDNSKAKRKRSQVVEASSASGHSEPSFGDEDEGKPTKKMKTSHNAHQNISIERNGTMEGEDGMGEAGEDEQTQPGDSSQRNGPRKKSSGLVSENFRALNMKVRRYSSRGRGTNYAAYKRKMWKQKQQANEKADSKKEHWKKRKSDSGGGTRRISSTTTTTCFKCGEDGHWAKDCPRNKPMRAQVPAENWSEPMKAPADLEIGDEQWEATEEKLQCLVSDRLPRAPDLPAEAPPAIEPLYQPVNDQPISTPQEVYDALNKLGFDSFRCGQEEAIMQILCGLSTLVVLSTGAGKSLCYQLPAYIYSKRSPCITLVISPLVSLMEDQVVGLPFGLHGVSLNTNMTKQQRQKAVDQICSGKAAVVLVSPEALVGGSSGAGCLPHPSKLPPIAFACIDEAHCVSEWSHNFRPSYLRVCKVLRERFGVRCFLGLTATATRSTALSVCEHLGITHRPEAIVRGATIPDNLNLSVSCDLNRDRAILELLQGSRFSNCDSIIIYCTRRDQTERLATYLRTCLQKNPMNTDSSITDQNEADDMEKENKKKKGGRKGRKSESVKSGKKSKSWQAECYHAGLSGAQRKKVQKKFMAGELRIVVATVAFGMGLDKADVRAVIHYNMPKSFESYVQEIGRAGRDGLPSHCHVFIDTEGKDVRELRRHAYASTVDRNTIKKLVHQIFPTCDCRTLHANMKKKQDKGLVDTESSADRLNKSANPDLDWFDKDDDVIEKMVELESQSSKELGKPETNRNEITAKTDSSQNSGVVDKVPQDDEVPKNDVTNTDDVTAGSDVIMSNDIIDSNIVTNTDVVKNDRVVNEDDVMTTDDVTDNDNDHALKDNDQETEDSNEGSNRICGGHEVAIPIEKAVQQLDMKEEAIETQLCYLELHAKRWVQILKSIRCTCTLKFYGGPAHLHYVAQRVPVVTAAVAYARKRKEFARNTSSLTFPIVEIVDEMGWDLEPVRRELYGLQWNEGLRLTGETGLSAGHSGIIVEFTDLAFHVRAPGDLSGNEKDEVCDFLEDRIMAQERSLVGQLHNVWSTFNAKAHPNCWESVEECDKKVDADLKSVIKAYFESKKDATQSELEALSSARKNSEFIQSVVPAEEPVNWDAVSRDIRSFITSHGDLELSGRAIARVFHGIDSPCFPASVWGRERRYWRRHLDVDFNLLRKCATKELVKFR